MPAHACVLFALLAPTFADPVPQVPLAFRLKVDYRCWGELDYLKVEQLRVNLQRLETMEETKIVSRFTVLEVRADGGAVLEQQIALVKHRALGQTTPPLAPQLQGAVVRITVDGSMRVKAVDGLDGLVSRLAGANEGPRAEAVRAALQTQLRFWLTDLLHTAPKRGVSRGDTWRQRAAWDLGGTGCVHKDQRFTAEETAVSGAPLKIHLTAGGTLTVAAGDSPKPCFKDRGPDLNAFEVRGVLEVDPVSGWLARARTCGRIELSGAGVVNGAPVDSWSGSSWVTTVRLFDHDPLADARPTPEPTDQPAPGASLRGKQTNSLGMTLVPIPAGKFQMGAPAGDAFRTEFDEVHQVEISRPFYLGAHEVTVGQFRQFVQATGYLTAAEKLGGTVGFNKATGQMELGRQYSWKNPGWDQTDDHPVVNVSWHDARAFCAWLSAREGKTYRLPTDAEWEYACRAGTTTRYCGGDDPETLAEVGNVTDASARKFFPQWQTIQADDGHPFTAAVGSYRPNAWGLYDMHGNALEWCEDWFWHPDLAECKDPHGPPLGTRRVQRGGSWADFPQHCTAARRTGHGPGGCCISSGFRVALAPAGEQAVALPDLAAPATWIGRRVLPKRDKLPGFAIRANAPPPQDTVFTVVEEKEGLLWIREPTVDGWLVKAEVVPLEEAVWYFTARIETIREDPSAYQLRAAARKALGDLRGSLKDLNEAIRLKPDWMAAYCCRASVHELLRDTVGAAADYEEAIQKGPPSPAPYYYRAQLHLRAKDWDRAITDFGEAARLASSSPHWGAPHNGRGEALRAKGDYDGAIAAYTEAIRREPQWPDPYGNRGLAHNQKKQHAEALADFNAVLRLVPGHPLALRSRGLTRLMLKDFDGAIADIDEALQAQTEGPLYAARGWAWFGKEDYDRAVADATEAVRLAPGQIEPRWLRAAAHAASKDHDLAIADLTEVLRLNPKHTEALAARAHEHAALGAYGSARADLLHALRLDPKLPQAHNGLAWLLATCPDAHYRNGKRAVAAARRACELTDWKKGYCLGTLGAALAEAGKFHEALRRQRQALLDPSFESAYGDSGRSQLELYKKRLPYREEP